MSYISEQKRTVNKGLLKEQRGLFISLISVMLAFCALAIRILFSDYSLFIFPTLAIIMGLIVLFIVFTQPRRRKVNFFSHNNPSASIHILVTAQPLIIDSSEVSEIPAQPQKIEVSNLLPISIPQQTPPQQSAGDYQLPVPISTSPSNIPIIPVVRHFMLPKEGEELDDYQDRYAFNEKLRRYAVADGVSQSFLSGEWAEIVSKSFVDNPYSVDFENKERFEQWLTERSREWYQLADTLISKDVAKRQQEKKEFIEWNRQLRNNLQEGAQTTLIGCSLLIQPDSFDVHVFAVGDANFFLFQQCSDRSWIYKAYPFDDPMMFTATPRTLGTSPEQIKRAWGRIIPKSPEPFKVQRGDIIVLASDELAKWFLTQLRQERADLWRLLYNKTLEGFKTIVEEERRQHRMGNDDMTMLIISIE